MVSKMTNGGDSSGGLFRHPLWLLVAGYWGWLIAACARDWTEVADYQHGWFVPPLALYFLWKRMEGGARPEGAVESEEWRVKSNEVGDLRLEVGEQRSEDRDQNRRPEVGGQRPEVPSKEWGVGTKGLRDEGGKGEEGAEGEGEPVVRSAGISVDSRQGDRGQPGAKPEMGRRGDQMSEVGAQRSEGLKLTDLKLKTPPRGGLWLAWGVVVVSLLLIFPLEVVRQAPLHWRLYPWLIGLVAAANTLAVAWLTGGRPAWRLVMVPTLFMLVGIPWPTAVENMVSLPLMGWVTQWSVGLLHMLGYPATAAGNVITLPNCTVGVEEACSGLRSLQTALLVGVAAGELARLRWVGRLALLGVSFGMALLANQTRVMMLALAGIAGGPQAVDNMHDLAGYAVLGVLLGGVALVTWGVMQWERALGGKGVKP